MTEYVQATVLGWNLFTVNLSPLLKFNTALPRYGATRYQQVTGRPFARRHAQGQRDLRVAKNALEYEVPAAVLRAIPHVQAIQATFTRPAQRPALKVSFHQGLLTVTRQPQPIAHGNALYVGKGYFLSAAHIIQAPSKGGALQTLNTVPKDRQAPLILDVVATDKTRDLALLKARTIPPNDKLPFPLPYAPNSRLHQGESIYLVGYGPQQKTPWIIPGQVHLASAWSDPTGKHPERQVITFDTKFFDFLRQHAQYQPFGLSGCVVLNTQGALVGTLINGDADKMTLQPTGRYYSVGVESLQQFIRQHSY